MMQPPLAMNEYSNLVYVGEPFTIFRGVSFSTATGLITTNR
jgi:hypothetical protein